MFPYERFVQWAAGPVSAGIGIVATDVVHQNISKNSALQVATFGLSAAATYLAHHKWLDNVAKWWDKSVPSSVRQEAGQVGGLVAEDIDKQAQQMYQEVATEHAAAEKVQNEPGKPAEQITAGLAPDSIAPVAQPMQSPTAQVPPQG